MLSASILSPVHHAISKIQKLRQRLLNNFPLSSQRLGLFVNADPELIQSIADECHLDMLQLHGDESPQFCQGFNRRVIKAVRIKDESSCSHLSDYRVSGYLLDTYVKGALGGTGVAFDWSLAVKAKQYGRIVLAGGLDPDNVASAVQQVRPYGVDVSSRVEASPGRKDPVKVGAFIQNVKEVDREWKQSN